MPWPIFVDQFELGGRRQWPWSPNHRTRKQQSLFWKHQRFERKFVCKHKTRRFKSLSLLNIVSFPWEWYLRYLQNCSQLFLRWESSERCNQNSHKLNNWVNSLLCDCSNGKSRFDRNTLPNRKCDCFFVKQNSCSQIHPMVTRMRRILIFRVMGQQHKNKFTTHTFWKYNCQQPRQWG